MIGKLAALTLATASVVHAGYLAVSVGGPNTIGANIFSPRVLKASIGDLVAFTFEDDGSGSTGNHSIVQTSADAPCTPLKGGFSSPLYVQDNSAFIINIDSDEPIYFACGSTTADHSDDHCQNGEVGIINPPTEFSTDDSEATDFVGTAQSVAHDGAMDALPLEGSSIGSGVSASVVGYLPAPVLPSNADAPAAGTGDVIEPLMPTGAASSAPALASSSSSHHVLSGGAIAGIAVGVLAVLLAGAAAAYRTVSAHKRRVKSEKFARRVSTIVDAREVHNVDAAMREREHGVQPKLEV